MTARRILHVVGRMDRAGAETMVMNLYREIDRSEFQFDFVYFTDASCDFDAEIEALGGRIHRILSNNPLFRFIALWRLMHTGKWSAVHAHTLLSSGLHLAAARLAKVPRRIAHAHNTRDANTKSLTRTIYRYLMRRMLAWASTSRVACGTAAAAFLFPGRSSVALIPNAIDVDMFASASGARVRQQLGLADDCMTVLQVGRFMAVKNHSFSLQIASALRDAGINFRMLFVGIGPDQLIIQSKVEALGLQGRVEFLGLREDIAELMAGADVMLMPSMHEGFPVVLVESQAAGLPAVVSTTISSEVDLGLGLVERLSLATPAEKWAEALCRADCSQIPEDTRRKQTLCDLGFSSRSGARLLETVYRFQ